MGQVSIMEEKNEIRPKHTRKNFKSDTKEGSTQMDSIKTIKRQGRIFLVDDDDEDRRIFISALEDLKKNVAITEFSNGVDLMAHLLDFSQELPDLIFLDLNMPLMNGEECLSDIRNEPCLDQIPVVIYSGYFDSLKMKILKKKGADHYFRKPNTFSQLKRLINDSLDKHF